MNINKPFDLWLLKNQEQTPVLRGRSKLVPIDLITTPEFQSMVDRMVTTMRRAKGIGLAAPQIGQPFKMAVIDGQANNQADPIVMINPVISQVSVDQEIYDEGCLSIPGLFGPVPRAVALTLKAFDRHGRPYQVGARGLFARVIQHEYDHLCGRLIIDRIRK